MNTRKRPAKTERRKILEARIYKLFHIAQRMPSTQEYGIGKYTINRALLFNDKNLRISINTVKRIVDEFVSEGTVECSNPESKTNLKFRLTQSRCFGCGCDFVDLIGDLDQFCHACRWQSHSGLRDSKRGER